MACFLVPTAEAIVVTVANKVSSKKESKNKEADMVELNDIPRISFHDKVKWLQNLLWGGSTLLAFEHVWHGEIVPWFPFLTAAENSTDFMEMLGEMSTVGVAMAALITAVWGCMLAGASIIEKRELKCVSLPDRRQP